MKSNFPLISVIIPVYNVEKYLPMCLDSVLAQTYTNLEIILVDDGSTDGSEKICDNYASKDIRVKVIHQRNQGVSSARNTGLKIAKGIYIGFVDADDYVEPDFYAYLHSLIYPTQADISVCGFFMNEIPQFFALPKLCYAADEALEMGMDTFEFYNWNKLFKKEILRNIWFDEKLSIAEDMLFCFKAFTQATTIAVGNLSKYHYRTRAQSATKTSFNLNKLGWFKVYPLFMQYAIAHKRPLLKRKVIQAKTYNAVGVLRQITQTDYNNRETIQQLQTYVREGIWQHLFSRYRLTNKLFALVCCVNFNLAKRIYKKLWRPT